WLYTNNTGALSGHPRAKDWTIAEISNLEDLRDIIAKLNEGDLQFDACVLDGIEGIRDFALYSASKQSKGDFVTQQDWGEAGRIMDTDLRTLRKLTGTLYATCNVYFDDTKSEWKLALNPDAL